MLARRPTVLAALAVLATMAYLAAAGRAWLAPSGTLRLWIGDRAHPEASQHLLDWYAPSHVVFGLGLWWLLAIVLPRLGVGWRFALATLAECGWEVMENTDAFIERFRTQTVSANYNGDSLVNVLADVTAMAVGFWTARALPWWGAAALVVGFEVAAAVLVRDGLLLNVLMLARPLEGVRAWQDGG